VIQLKTPSENSCRFTWETGAKVLQVLSLGILPMAFGPYRFFCMVLCIPHHRCQVSCTSCSTLARCCY